MAAELTFDQPLQFSISEITPERVVVYQSQGINPGANVSQKIADLYDRARAMFIRDVQPKGIMKEISITEFAEIFHENGENDEEAPLQHIFPQADSLALFALTLGETISNTISDLFSKQDFALATMLDSIASSSADKAASIVELNFNQSSKTLLYSPGYCGWNISGQKQLFEKLEPERIGISLTNQCLMIPLKSISGVLATGKKEIHNFDNTFTFCAQCKTFSCIDR